MQRNSTSTYLHPLVTQKIKGKWPENSIQQTLTLCLAACKTKGRRSKSKEQLKVSCYIPKAPQKLSFSRLNRRFNRLSSPFFKHLNPNSISFFINSRISSRTKQNQNQQKHNPFSLRPFSRVKHNRKKKKQEKIKTSSKPHTIKPLTFVDRLDEGFDVAFLAENEGCGRAVVCIARKWIINWDSGGIIASVLQTPQAIEENFENVAPLSVDAVIQVGEYSTHSLRIWSRVCALM